VASVTQDREALLIHTEAPEPVLRELFAADASLHGLEITSAGLEDAFLSITQSHAPNSQEVLQ